MTKANEPTKPMPLYPTWQMQEAGGEVVLDAIEGWLKGLTAMSIAEGVYVAMWRAYEPPEPARAEERCFCSHAWGALCGCHCHRKPPAAPQAGAGVPAYPFTDDPSAVPHDAASVEIKAGGESGRCGACGSSAVVCADGFATYREVKEREIASLREDLDAMQYALNKYRDSHFAQRDDIQTLRERIKELEER